MTDTPARILLLGTHGQYNIGDELLLETFLHQLGDQHSYVINTYDPADTAARLGSRYQFSLINTAGDRWALLQHLRRADALVFAGGSILKELSAATGRNRYSTLLMILAIVTAARWLGRAPLAMLNIGVGPIRTPRGRRLAGMILNRVNFVAVRDEASAELCRTIGVKTNVISSTDAVLSVTPEWLLGSSTVGTRAPGGPLRIALSLNHDIEVPENWEHVMATLSQAMRELASERPIEVHGLPMQSRGKTHDDATVLREFAARMPEVTFVEHLPNDHHDVAGLIASCDVLVAERLHAIITSAKLGVPVVPLVYDIKVREVARSLGIDDLGIDLGTPFEASAVTHSITRVADDLPAARARLAEKVDALTMRARSSFDGARAWLAARGRTTA